MSILSLHLAQLVRSNPTVTAAWYDDPQRPTTLHVCTAGNPPHQALNLPNQMPDLPVIFHSVDPFNTLIERHPLPSPQNNHQTCQDEPVKLGCQVQPANANWVGTGGAPCSWKDATAKRRYGILSNWHVMANGQPEAGRPIHQPDTGRPMLAMLSNWSPVVRDGDNKIDAAIADAQINGLHTISPDVLDVGKLNPDPGKANPGLAVCKSGRTTALTCGTCVAVGATVQVGYGDFTATFVDQDVFEGDNESFSAPGDSGSLIVTQASHSPIALLFAGNSQLTIGNPIRHVIDRFNLSFLLN